MPRTTINIPQDMLDAIDAQMEEDFSNRSSALMKLWRQIWSQSTSTCITAHQPASSDAPSTSPSPARGRESLPGSIESLDPISLSSETELPPGLVKAVIGHLNKRAGSSFRASAKTWRKLIRARVAEGATEADFFTVIDKKTKGWIGTEWQKFLRPETLFGTKFNGYLGELESKPHRGNHAGAQREAKFAARRDKSKYLTGQEPEIDPNDEAPPF